MTLKNQMLLALATCCLLSTVVANASNTPGRGIPGPRDQYDPGPPAPGVRPGQLERRTVYFGQQVVNGRLNLRDLVGIDSFYHGYSVESVELEIQSDYNTQVSLLMDGHLDSSAYSPQGLVILRPRYRAIIGENLTNLLLDVRGRVYIHTVTINLRKESYGRPDHPGYTTDIPVYLNLRLSGNNRVDVGMYLDMYRYRGYRLQAIEVQAAASYNMALVDLHLDGFKNGQTLQLDRYSRTQVIHLYNAILGQTASSIVLATRGDLNIYQVVFKLSPR